MTSIEIMVPDAITQYILEGTNEKVRNAMLIYPSIVNSTISYGRAAELLGMSKIELIQIYGRMGLPYHDMTDEEFGEEIKTVKRLVQNVNNEQSVVTRRRDLTTNFCGENPFKPLNKNEIMSELAQARTCYERGEGEDFDKAIEEVGAKYGL